MFLSEGILLLVCRLFIYYVFNNLRFRKNLLNKNEIFKDKDNYVLWSGICVIGLKFYYFLRRELIEK